jgi:AraC-like DNA-binding protein
MVIRLSDAQTSIIDGEDVGRRRILKGGCLSGPQSKFFVLDRTEQDHMIGVHFKPGGAYAVFGCPVTEFAHHHFELSDIWGSRAESLRSELLEAAGPAARFDVLERRLLEAHRDARERHPAVAFLLRELGAKPFGVSLADLADRAGYSSKRMTQLFAREVGLTPKVFTRLERFQRVLRRLQGLADVDWSDIALSCGYFDQAHFNHDFRDFSGLNPTTYMARRTPHLNHIPL